MIGAITPKVAAGLSILGPVIGAIAAAAEVGGILVNAGKAAWGFAQKLEQSSELLRNISPQMAQIFTESDFRGFVRQRESGARRSETTRELVDAMDDLRDQVQPTLDALVNLGNIVASVGVRATPMLARFIGVVAEMNTGIPFLTEAWNKFNNLLSGEGKLNDSWMEFMKEFEKETNAERRKRGGREDNFFNSP